MIIPCHIFCFDYFRDCVAYSKLINVVSVGFTCIENHVLLAADEAKSIWAKFGFIRPR
jgi:hypothetical protein